MPRIAPWTLVLALLLAISTAVPTAPVVADQEDADEAVEDRQERARKEAADERSEGIKRDFLYKRTLKANMFTVGPYSVNTRVDGEAIAGFISFAIQADTISNRSLIENYKPRVDEIIFPLAIEMYRDGRPGPAQFERFKESAMDGLTGVFGDRVQDIFVYQML